MSMIGGIDMLQAGEIKLIPMGLKDAEFIVNLRNKEEVFNYSFSNIPLYDFGHNRWLNEINTTNNIFFIIEHKEKKIGYINITNIDYLNEKGEYAIALDPQETGKGIAYKASQLLFNYVFTNLKINKIYLLVFSENERAKKLYEKLGFEQEGYFKKEVFKNGRFQNVIRMALFRDEWLKNEDNI